MKTYSRSITVGIAVALGACGGGGSASAPASVTTPPAPPDDEIAGGLWFGTLSFDMHPVTEEFVALSTDDGRFRLLSVDSTIQMAGQAAVAGSAFSGSGRAFSDAGVTWLDGNTTVDLSVDAVLEQRDSFAGAWSVTSGESGTFEFFYESLYERASSLALLHGVWTSYDEFGNPAVSFAITGDGSFDGQNSAGCVSSGRFSIIDERYNLYAIDSTISNCAIAGDYSGLGVIADLVVANDALIVSIDDGNRAILLGFEK